MAKSTAKKTIRLEDLRPARGGSAGLKGGVVKPTGHKTPGPSRAAGPAPTTPPTAS